MPSVPDLLIILAVAGAALLLILGVVKSAMHKQAEAQRKHEAELYEAARKIATTPVMTDAECRLMQAGKWD